MKKLRKWKTAALVPAKKQGLYTVALAALFALAMMVGCADSTESNAAVSPEPAPAVASGFVMEDTVKIEVNIDEEGA